MAATADGPSPIPPESLDRVERLLLIELDRHGSPLGGAVLHGLLSEQGVHVSVSTIARRLRRLDRIGLTDPALLTGQSPASDGRVLSDEGRRLVATTLRVQRAAHLIAQASEITISEGLHDHLTARMAVEPAAAADAARHRSAAMLAELEESLALHELSVQRGVDLPAGATVQFHRLVASACRNALLRSMLAVVLDATLDELQGDLDALIRCRDTDDEGLADHRRILSAVRAGDGPAAEEAMRAHMQRLVDELERFQAGTGRPLRRR